MTLADRIVLQHPDAGSVRLELGSDPGGSAVRMYDADNVKRIDLGSGKNSTGLYLFDAQCNLIRKVE